jgi:ClpP class serine protease
MHPVFFGRLKAMEERASVTGMTAEALAGVQAEVDTLGELFVTTVARNRGIPAVAVRAQEGACFLGADGVAAGLADTLCAPEQAFKALLADLGSIP